MISQDPSPSSIRAHRWEEKVWSGEELGAQDLCTAGPGALLWEQKSTVHWVVMISGATGQTKLEYSGRLKLLTPGVGDRHAPEVPQRPKTEVAV